MTRKCHVRFVRELGSVTGLAYLPSRFIPLSPRSKRRGSRRCRWTCGSRSFTPLARPPPEASEKIVVVRFHIMGHVGKAIDTVRKQEVREGWVPELKGSKYLWLYSKENLPESQRQRFEALPGHEPESGTGVGDERGASRPVACDLPGGSPRLLEALVRMGNSKTGHTHARGRSSDQAPFGQCPDIHHASDHQRCERRVELQDPDDQETGLRISEQGPIQDSHLLSLNGLDFYPSWSAQCKWHLFGPLRFPEGPKKDYSIWMDETFIPKLLPEEY